MILACRKRNIWQESEASFPTQNYPTSLQMVAYPVLIFAQFVQQAQLRQLDPRQPRVRLGHRIGPAGGAEVDDASADIEREARRKAAGRSRRSGQPSLKHRTLHDEGGRRF